MDSAVVLVVESDFSTRSWMVERIAMAGHRALGAIDAQAALSALERDQPHVMVLGRLPPGVPARSLLELALPRAAGTAALVVSEKTSVQAGVEAMKLGAADFMVLPCTPEAFDAAVMRVLRLSRTRRRIARNVAAAERCVMVGNSPAMQRAREMIEQLARSDATTVLVEGETGTGKEVVAQAIHARSARSKQPFLQVNCAALPETLVESELFGHEKGAFTTAHAQRPGIFEAARGGTVLLDELGDLPPSGQAKLLRLLENKTFRRVGGLEELTADVRVVAATHRDLETLVTQGRFRSDLFYRLNVVRVHLPPLRERREDIAALAAWFTSRFNEHMKRQVHGITNQAMEILEDYCWPGNVRELRNVIERAFILYPQMEELHPGHLPAGLRCNAELIAAAPHMPTDLALPVAERRLLADTMRRAQGNQVHAARMLGITRFTLRYRLKKHGLSGQPRTTTRPVSATA